MSQSPLYNVLNFFHDEHKSCALTILATQTRFHIIADVDNLRHKTTSSADNSDIWEHYSQLLAKYKQKNEGEECNSRDESIDSGVDVASSLAKEGELKLPNGLDAETTLYEWLVSSLRSELSGLAEASQHRNHTLSEWYNFPTRFFNLMDRDGKLYAEELESTSDLEKRMSKLCPNLGPVPQNIHRIDVPRLSSKDLKVLSCSNSPPPFHPTVVELPESSSDKMKQKLFFKGVDNANIQPTKREISLLHQLENKGLHDKLRCPQLMGIVTREGDENSIMGFLQTLIPGPTPLTEKFESEIPQELREKWAKEAEQMKDTLHEHGIIWGDAKGDNFVVDSSDELWIIDFGGSYTEGWVDPEIAETKEGDDMGVEKVVNALRDPERNVARGSEDEGESIEETKGDKRKGSVDEEPRESKRRRTASRSELPTSTEGTAEPKYCYCDGVSAGEMIGCDGPDCQLEWFHVECTGLAELPKEEEAWFCRNCASS